MELEVKKNALSELNMRDPKRIKKICQLLENAWSCYPDQRLGQFLISFVFGSYGRDSHVYFREDDDVETSLILIFTQIFAKYHHFLT